MADDVSVGAASHRRTSWASHLLLRQTGLLLAFLVALGGLTAWQLLSLRFDAGPSAGVGFVGWLAVLTLLGLAILLYRLRYESERIDAANEALRVQTQALSSLLDNMHQAVFSIDTTGRVLPPVSRHTRRVFGAEVEGCAIDQVLYSSFADRADILSRIRSTLDVVFGAGELQWNLMQENLPRRVDHPLRGDDGRLRSRVLRVSHSPVWDDAGLLERILYVVEDITDVDRLEREVSAQRQVGARNIFMLQEMAASDTAALDEFFTQSVGQLRRNDPKLLAEPDEVHALFRALHTLKGNARVLHLSGIAEAAHEAEHAVGTLRDQVEARGPVEVRGVVVALGRLRDRLAHYNRLAGRVFKVKDRFRIAGLADAHERAVELDLALNSLWSGDRTRRLERLELAHAAVQQLKRLADELLEADLAEQVAGLDQRLDPILRAARERGHLEMWTGAAHDLSGLVDGVRSAVHRAVWASGTSPPLNTSRDAWVPVLAGLVGLNFQSSPLTDAVRLRGHCTAWGLSYLERIFARVAEGEADPFADPVAEALRFAMVFLWLELRFGSDATRRERMRRLVDDTGRAGPIPDAASGTLVALMREIGRSRDTSAIWAALAAALGRTVPETVALLLGDALPADGVEAADAVLREASSWTAVGPALEDAGSGAAACVALALAGSQDSFSGSRYLFRHDLVRLLAAYRVDVVGGAAVPVATALSRFGPMVSELARELGKTAQLVVHGGDVPLPRIVLPHVRDVLLHLLRNAVDHGLEPADERVQAGKPAGGTLVLSFDRREDGSIQVELEDDGRGVDLDAVVRAAVARGVLRAEAIAYLTEHELLELMFSPGVSTASKITEISGRGVGLDAVAESLDTIGARIFAFTTPGQGTRFVMVLPPPEAALAAL